jgi:zinc/manganese transport system permease protein
VGVYLVFASLIVPALATRHVGPPRRRQALALMVGVAAYAAGLALSALADLPSGAVVVFTMAAFGILVALIATAGAGAAGHRGAGKAP